MEQIASKPVSVVNWDARPGMPLLGFELRARCVALGITYRALARRLANRGWKVSSQYVGMIVNGKRAVTPQKLNLICQALHLDQPEREQLHRCAATDLGFQIW